MGIVFLLMLLAVLGMAILVMASMYTVFEKAGEPGWSAFIPFYNLYQLVKIAHLPGPALVLFFLPLVNYVFPVYVWFRVARQFRQGVAFSLFNGIFPVFGLPYLAFSENCRYGPNVPARELIAQGRRYEQGAGMAPALTGGMPNIADAGWQAGSTPPAQSDLPPVEAAYGGQPRKTPSTRQAPAVPKASAAGGVTFGVDL